MGAIVKAVAILFVLGMGYAAFEHARLDKQRYSWFWDLDDSYGDRTGEHESSKGSKYLLGVGKADITG